jgi:hypothetical protein
MVLTPDALRSLLAGVVAAVKGSTAGGDSSSDGSDKKPETLPPADLLMKQTIAAIDEGRYFDVCALCHDNLEFLKRRSAENRKDSVVKIGDQEFRSTAVTAKSYADCYEWSTYSSGFLKALEAYLKSGKSHLALDRLLWFIQLYHFQISPSSKKTAYAKSFHFKYADSDDWDNLFKTDAAMLLTHLMSGFSGQEKPPRSLSSSDRPLPARRGEIRDRGRDPRPRRDNNRRGRDPPAKKRKSDLATCHSRTDKAATCTFARCRFSHDCGSCGRDHAAKDCPNWDQAKADKKKKN